MRPREFKFVKLQAETEIRPEQLPPDTLPSGSSISNAFKLIILFSLRNSLSMTPKGASAVPRQCIFRIRETTPTGPVSRNKAVVG